MKAFTHFVAELNRGATNAALTGHLEELLQAVKTHGRDGSLKITLKVVPVRNNSGADTIHVICDSQLALPKAQQPADFFFLTEDGEPTRQHPQQHELDIAVREVRPQSGPVIDPASRSNNNDFSNPDADGVITPRPEAGRKQADTT